MNKCIIWDWNGTLLDDVNEGILARNKVFKQYGLSMLNSVEQYRDEFTFPIKDYYFNAGVTEDNFVEIAHKWVDEYMLLSHKMNLRYNALETINEFKKKNYIQVLLSASNINILNEQINQFKLHNTFNYVFGLDNIYAKSKVELAKNFVSKNNAYEYFLIGDTLHDFEVASEIGAKCILVMNGHQSLQKLKTSNAIIAKNLEELISIIS